MYRLPEVLFLGEHYPPLLGGTSRMFHGRFRQYPSGSVIVLTSEAAGSQAFDKTQAYPIVRIPIRRNGPRGFEWLGPVWQFLRAGISLARAGRKFSTIECARPLPEGIAGLLLSVALRKRLIVNYHGEDISVLGRYRVERALLRFLARRAWLNLANSHFTAGLIRGLAGDGARIEVVHPGFDSASVARLGEDRIRALRADVDGSPILLTVGRLQRRKGQDRVIQALPAIRASHPGVRYLIVGSAQGGTDGLRRELADLAKAHGVEENLVFVGETDAEGLNAYYNICDLFLMPNREEAGGDVEGFGIVFLEAGCLGKPVIGGRSGGVPDAIVDGVTGLLVDGESPESIAAGALKVLGDDALRAGMGAQGRRFALSLAEDKVFAAYSRALEGFQANRFAPGERLSLRLRMAAASLFNFLLSRDRARAEALSLRNWRNRRTDPAGAEALQARIPGLAIEGYLEGRDRLAGNRFVWEDENHPQYRALRETFGLDAIVSGAESEYDAMLRLAGWMGGRWDHGKDPVPGGHADIDPVAAILAGQAGAKFWCEIASVTGAMVFSSMGWASRVATASRNGRKWEHAVTEIWSNQFGKWFVIDMDFNVVFESGGAPLSAYELCHDGPDLSRQGRLEVRPIGPPKPSLPLVDLMPFFAYVHVDMRTDWKSRKLRRGSPAGGDEATWWTGRKDFDSFRTSKVRVDDRGRFDWPVNAAWIHVLSAAGENGGYALELAAEAYCPYFKSLETRVDGGEWVPAGSGAYRISLPPGRHRLGARAILSNGRPGPVRILTLDLPA